MSGRQYPRDVWVLTPSFAPKKVAVVKRYASYSSLDYGDMTEKGKLYQVDDMHPSLEAAIAVGRAKVAALQADLVKRQDTINKRIAALDKAEKGGAA